MNRVWISAAGTGNAFATTKALRKNFPGCFLLTTDTNPAYLTTASLWSDAHRVSPAVDNEKFRKFIRNTIEEFQIDTYIPFIDKEISIAAAMYAAKKIGPGLRLQVKNPKVAEICENKLFAHYFLLENGLPSPQTADLQRPFKAGKYILKPASGFGSQVKIVTPAELKDPAYRYGYIVQEVCEQPEVTVDVAWSKLFNRFHFICRQRIQTKSGVCTKARVFLDDNLGALAFALAQGLELHSFCFQVMRLRGKWVVTDINPRLGAGSAISAAAGSDFFSAMLAIFQDQDPAPFLKPLERECHVTRQYTEFLMPA